MSETETSRAAPSALTGSTVIRRLESPRIEHVELDGETVVYEALRSRLHLLDAAATMVWQLLDGTTSLDALSRVLAETMHGSPDEFFEDVCTFAEHLERLGIVERVA